MGELFVSAIVTLVSVFAGAWLAFRFNEISHNKRERAKNLTAGNKAMFTLLRQWNRLVNIRQQIIAPVVRNPIRAIVMLPVLHSDHQEIKFDFDSLGFLFETDSRGLMAELMLAEEKFQTTMRVLDERSRFHFETIQPSLEAAGISEGNGYIEQQIISALGDQAWHTISRLTDDVIENVDDSIKFIEELRDKFRDALVKLKYTVIGFGPLDWQRTPSKET